MTRVLRPLLALMLSLLMAGGFLVAASTAADASDGDCANLVSTYRDGSSRYAVVSNVCGHGIRARAVVDHFPDTACVTIPAKGRHTFRTGGVLSPSASAGREC